jgi:hypothetical protein
MQSVHPTLEKEEITLAGDSLFFPYSQNPPCESVLQAIETVVKEENR